MENIELKFVLKLLDAPNYREALAKIKLSSLKASDRDKTCRQLLERELVGVTYEVSKFKIASAGMALLKIESVQLPVTAQELKILNSCQKAAISPSKTGIAAPEAQKLVQALLEKGLIQVNKTDKKIKEVWLTERGKEYLQQQYDPSGKGNITLTKNMLATYLKFLRQPPLIAVDSKHKPNDGEILQIIQDLDKEFGTDNYLPIFYLREKLQPSLSREDLEQALYRLEGSDKIELSALVESSRYSPAQVNAGIKQRSGSPLFFIKVND
ncbi:hypothetical protein [Synechocystis sp. PCC 7509]|uniref:hypothetical protein n=1 Tax=Synechocystis sp. PCC 7509 TaxID=927677 RepID=UPI0002ABD135|nr:hypothetical protein [Synechocystis sp. PCC 7509]